jgi:hypothetical protein
VGGTLLTLTNIRVPETAALHVLAAFTFAFACLEKTRKEHFVVAVTNAKMKKSLLGLLNQMPMPIAIVNVAKGGSPSHSNQAAG